MGCRGNIGIIQDARNETPLFLYTHWTGHRVNALLADGLVRTVESGRITDRSYATRIIFDTLTEGSQGTTGYGISVGEPDDNEYPIPTIVWGWNPLDPYGPPKVAYEGADYTPEQFIKMFRLEEASSTADEVPAA